jgi:hypothetical protein
MKNEIKSEINIVGMQNNLNLNSEAANKFVAGITPQFVKDAGGILSDTIKSWRLINQIKILHKTKELCDRHNIPLNTVNLKFLVPMIESSSLEEEETMQNRWAALLANAVKNEANANPNYIDILKQITPKEASILDGIYFESLAEVDYKKRNTLQFSKKSIMRAISLKEEEFDLILDNLFRLNLCRMTASHGGVKIGDHPIMVQTKDIFELTSLGFSFVQACQFNSHEKRI